MSRARYTEDDPEVDCPSPLRTHLTSPALYPPLLAVLPLPAAITLARSRPHEVAAAAQSEPPPEAGAGAGAGAASPPVWRQSEPDQAQLRPPELP